MNDTNFANLYNIEPLIEEDDERVSDRAKVLKRGIIGFGEEYASIPCLVRDLSDHGAKVELETLIALPKRFTLHIEIDGFKVDCRLAWQKHPHAGIQFVGEKHKTALARKQVLGTQENALSEQFQKDMEMRERAEQATHQAKQPTKPSHLTRKTPVFGKRAFKG